LRRIVPVLAALILCYALALGAARRAGHPRLAFCGSTDEFSEIMPGLRLHALPLWNLGAAIRSNFFKSFMYSPHGMDDSAFYYLAGGASHGLGLSISARGGARAALEVRYHGRLLGRAWRFDQVKAEVMELEGVPERWDRVGHLPRLLQQSLAGTAYHFGAVWPRPAE